LNGSVNLAAFKKHHSEDNSEIVHTIIKLAQNLKMKVVAEGIETVDQLTKLRQLKCEYGQEYFFAKPLGSVDILSEPDDGAGKMDKTEIVLC